MNRIHDIYRPAEERTRDWCEVERMLSKAEAHDQTERCQNCGIPFCHGAGCPLGNLVPDQNCASGASLVVHALASGKSLEI